MGAFYDSSLLAWVEAVAVGLVPRLEGADALAVEILAGPGIDERRARRVFGERLARRLGDEDVSVVPRRPGIPALALTLSFSGSDAWAIGALEVRGSESALAARFSLDRELEALLGATQSHLGQGRWVLERMGAVPAGVLDLRLLDLDDRDGDEIALLTVDGLRTLRFDPGAARPTPLGGPWPLGTAAHADHPAGWLAQDGDLLLATTSAWPSSRIDPRSGQVRPIGSDELHLGQPEDPARPSALPARRLEAPEVGVDLAELAPGGPNRVRDLQLWPGGEGLVWVDAAGRLGGRGPAGEPVALSGGAVGDRVVLGDLDADGRMDLATTAASSPGDPDQLSVHRLDGSATPLLFQAEFVGGISALGLGDLDFDGAPDLLFVEEAGGAEAVLWRLERRR